MKIKGKKIENPNREIIAIPRGMEDDIIFVADAILDMEPFDKMCPVPMPPFRKISGVDVPNLKDPHYLKKLDRHATKRMAWMVLTSLEATEGLEWETVDLADSSTWHLFRDELRSAGFSDMEVNRIVSGVISVNALSESKIEAARDRFLLLQQVPQNE